MKLLVSSLILIGLSLTALTYLSVNNSVPDVEGVKNAEKQFQEYLNKFKIAFKNAEERTYRLKIFLENIAQIAAHNLKSNKTYTQGVNQFSHMTDEEFAETYLTLTERAAETSNYQNFVNQSIPSSVDWRQQGAVTPVKNQGGCGSCYAFSATGALEGLNFLQTGTLNSYSEQQVIDCSWKYHNNGCHGGFMDNVFNFVKDRGITTEQSYPYQGHAHLFKCQQKTGEYKISGHFDVKKGDCQNLEQAIAQQPVSVAIDARKVKSYQSGILTDCGQKIKLNHGVLAVGYTPDAFIIKNSWGTRFGEQGYFRLSKNNTCGVCEAASYPTA